MTTCPYLTKTNHCDVASRIAECNVLASAKACVACQRDQNPQAINAVTIGMAIVNRKRRKQPITTLTQLLKNYLHETEEPVTLKIATHGPGPGSELKKMLAWFARPSESCNCPVIIDMGRAETMNDWGTDGCRQNFETIVDWLMEEAKLRGLPNGKFTRIIAQSLVTTAIRRFERKLPDGAPDPDDEDRDEQQDR